MLIQEQIEKAIRSLVRKKDKVTLSQNLKYIKSEIQRIGKVVPDEDVIPVIKKFIKNEKSLPNGDKESIEFLSKFIPETMTDTEIIAWIHQNIDFSTVPNKMAAMKPIMEVLKHKGVDGNRVKTLLEKM